jgi:pectin methylesterase-like acyl-CoA thioesterase
MPTNSANPLSRETRLITKRSQELSRKYPRSVRHSVRYQGVVYSSIRAALDAAGVDSRNNQKKRKTMVETGSVTVEGKRFELAGSSVSG